MLRYLVLQQQGLLKTDFSYDENEQKQMTECVGKESFSFSSEGVQDFGYIYGVSPVFLLNNEEQIYIKNPFQNNADKGYKPMRMKAGYKTDKGIISLPQEGEFDVKKWYASGYYNLNNGEIVNDIFDTHIVVGNRKNDKKENSEDGFFKREIITMKSGYSFGVFVEAKELPTETIAYMGKKKSAFRIQSQEVENGDLASIVESAFKDHPDTWYYALSDILLDESPIYEEFCIVEEKHLRNLETVHSETSCLRKLKKRRIRYQLIQSGSVFYRVCNLNVENENCKKIGYNHLVRLGGN